MVTTGDRGIFLDTNVLVYAAVETAPMHNRALTVLQTLYAEGEMLWISRQIIREYLVTLSRPDAFPHPLSKAALADNARLIQSRFQIAEDGPPVTDRLFQLIEQFGISGKKIHDANIVATMQTYGIGQLLTHNSADFERYAGLISILPLQSA